MLYTLFLQKDPVIQGELFWKDMEEFLCGCVFFFLGN